MFGQDLRGLGDRSLNRREREGKNGQVEGMANRDSGTLASEREQGAHNGSTDDFTGIRQCKTIDN